MSVIIQQLLGKVSQNTHHGKRKRQTEKSFPQKRSKLNSALVKTEDGWAPQACDFLELKPEGEWQVLPKMDPCLSFPVVSPEIHQNLGMCEPVKSNSKPQLRNFRTPSSIQSSMYPVKIEPFLQKYEESRQFIRDAHVFLNKYSQFDQPVYHQRAPQHFQRNTFNRYVYPADADFHSPLESLVDIVLKSEYAARRTDRAALDLRDMQSKNAILSRKLGYSVRYLNIPEVPGRKPKIKIRWHLYCAHCSRVFCARPTPKNSRYVVNHTCTADARKRKQYVIGVKRRHCQHQHKDCCITRITFE